MSDAALKVMAAHRPRWNVPGARISCSCGWVSDDPVVFTDFALHDAHLLAVLSETHAVVELPEPEQSEFHGQEWRRDFEDGWGTSGMSGPRAPRVVINHDGEIGMLTVPTSNLRPDIATFVGVSLLAAARAAEAAR